LESEKLNAVQLPFDVAAEGLLHDISVLIQLREQQNRWAKNTQTRSKFKKIHVIWNSGKQWAGESD
jgi:hypothetical protein